MGVGDGDRSAQQAALGQPVAAGHLAVAVQAVHRAVAELVALVRGPGMHHRHAGACHPRLVVHHGAVPHRHAHHVGDGVGGPGGQGADREPEVAETLTLHAAEPTSDSSMGSERSAQGARAGHHSLPRQNCEVYHVPPYSGCGEGDLGALGRWVCYGLNSASTCVDALLSRG